MKRNRSKNLWILGFLLVLALLLLLSMGRRGFVQQVRISQYKKKLEREIETLKKEKALLEDELKKLDDPEYVEKVAREKYGMAKKNEKVYRVVPKDD